jgi:F-type H+-transporting ATPase subunit alpha
VEKQVAILWVVTNGYLDDVPPASVRDFEARFYAFLEAERPEVLTTLAQKLALDDEIVDALRSAAEAFKDTFSA